MKYFAILFLSFLLGSTTQVEGGPLAYGICQTGCNGLAVVCFGACGVTMGTITLGLGSPACVLACAAAQGTCMAACVAAGLSPTP